MFGARQWLCDGVSLIYGLYCRFVFVSCCLCNGRLSMMVCIVEVLNGVLMPLLGIAYVIGFLKYVWFSADSLLDLSGTCS